MTTTMTEPDETELNMTPMIDIVFQLIVFFLLTLKFKTVDRRIDAMLPNEIGMDTRPAPPIEEDKIKVKVFRRQLRDRNQTFTLVRVDNAAQFRLPRGWKGRLKESSERLAEYDRIVASVQAEIEKRVAVYGGIPGEIAGEIVAPPPKGGSVPHGDVVSMLNAFLATGITKVKFEGAMAPISRHVAR
jgi:biopolymer transport protein ExbD